MPKTKSCPMCGEEILATAKKCKHCTSNLVKPPFKIGLLDGFFAILFVFNTVFSIMLAMMNIGAHPKDVNFTPTFICLASAVFALFLCLLVRAIRKSSYNQKWAGLNTLHNT